MQSPGHVPVGLVWIVVRAKDGDVMLRRQLAAQVERVDFGAGPMSREEIVNRVNDSHFT